MSDRKPEECSDEYSLQETHILSARSRVTNIPCKDPAYLGAMSCSRNKGKHIPSDRCTGLVEVVLQQGNTLVLELKVLTMITDQGMKETLPVYCKSIRLGRKNSSSGQRS